MDSGKTNWQNFLKKISKDVQISERSLAHDDEENKKERRDQMKAREEYFSRTQKRLNSFKTALGGIKERLDDICHGRAGAEVIQPMLEAFERKLTDFKIIMRDDFVDLENEENELTRDVNLAATRLEGWLAANDGIGKVTDGVTGKQTRLLAQSRLQLELDRQSRIGAIDKQLANMGGRTGRWDTRDHDSFIKVWTQLGCTPVEMRIDSSSRGLGAHSEQKRRDEDEEDDDVNRESQAIDEEEEDDEFSPPPYGSKNSVIPHRTLIMTLPRNQVASLLRRLPVNVPGKLQEELEEHIDWYLKMLSLTTEKKKLLSKWKEDKLTEEKDNIASTHNMGTARGGNSSDPSADDLLREAAAEIEDRANARLKVSEWRAQKEREREQALLKEKDSTSHESKRREDEVKRRQLLTRAQVDQWREAESSSQSALKRAGEEAARLAKRAVSVDPAEVRRRQARDIESTKQRIEQKQAHKHTIRPRSQIISEISAGTEFTQNARRDTQRLQGPTKASSSSAVTGEHLDQAQKRRSSAPAHSSSVAMSGRDLKYACRAIPVWCRPPT